MGQILQYHMPQFLHRLQLIKKISFNAKLDQQMMRAFRHLINELTTKHAFELVKILKEIMLMRLRDRSVRENSIRAIKQLLKIN